MEQQMEMPKWKYVLIYGVLSWGISTAILYTLAMSLIVGRSINSILRKDIWINLVTFMIAGIFFGLILRKMLPRYILKLKDKEKLS